MADPISGSSSSMSVVQRESGAYAMASRKMGDAEIDAVAVAEQPIEVAKARTEKIQKEIDAETAQRTKLQELKPHLLALSQTADSLRGLNPAKGVKNVFKERLALVKGALSDFDQTYLSANSLDGASVRDFKMKISQQASSDVLTSAAAAYYADNTTALGLTNGNLTINGSTVAITSTMNLQDVADAINASDIFNVQGVQANVAVETITGVNFYRLELVPQMGGKLTITDDQAGAITSDLYLVQNEYTPLGLSGNLVIDGRTIAIDASMTLYDIRNGIRMECSQQTTKPCSADVDFRGSGDMRLFLSRNDTGDPISLTGSSAGILSALGWTLAGSGKTTDDLIAKFSVDYGDGNWVASTRTTNTFDDVIENLSLTITGITPALEELTVSVAPNLGQVKSTISTFVDLTNKVLDFLNEQNQRGPDGKPTKDAILAGNDFLRKLSTTLRTNLNALVSGLEAGDYTSLQDIGIALKYSKGNFSLVLDDPLLTKALNTDADKVMRVLGFQFQSTNSSFLMPNSPQQLSGALSGKDIGVSVTKQADVVSAYYTLNGINYPANIDENGKITPQDGSQFTTMAPIYLIPSVLSSLVNGDTQTSTIRMSQGALDVFGNNLRNIVQQGLSIGAKKIFEAGAYENEDQRIYSQIERQELRIEKINEKAEREKEKILVAFERMQGILELAKQMRATIASYFAAQNKQN